VAINNVLPLLSYNVFGPRGYQRPTFNGFINIRYATPQYIMASLPLTSYHLAQFVWVPLADFCVQSLAMK